MSDKYELILRALNTSATALQPEDLSRLMELITPRDVPMFSRLARSKATGLLHEWVESSLTASFTAGAYADGGIPAGHDNTHVRKDNKVMSVGRIASATNLMRAVDTIGASDALALELEEKMVDIMRVIEYYIFNGDRDNTSPQEMDGLLNIITTGNGATEIDGVSGYLTEAVLQSALVGCYNNGGSPNIIVARPEVAQRIANFTDDKIRFNGAGGGAGGVGAEGLRYLNPFGPSLDVIPVRSSFLPSGNVLVLDSSKIKLAFLSNLIEILPLAITTDAESKLLKAYLTLECRAVAHHALIKNVAD